MLDCKKNINSFIKKIIILILLIYILRKYFIIIKKLNLEFNKNYLKIQKKLNLFFNNTKSNQNKIKIAICTYRIKNGGRARITSLLIFYTFIAKING